jgi:hypothetical protein
VKSIPVSYLLSWLRMRLWWRLPAQDVFGTVYRRRL